MKHEDNERLIAETLLEGGWTKELIATRSGEAVKISPEMEAALNRAWRIAAVSSEKLNICRGAYWADKSADPSRPLFVAINNIDGYGYREVFSSKDEALRFLNDSQLDSRDSKSPLFGLNLDASYLRFDRDEAGKITGYELIFWDDDANDGLGAFCQCYGEPAAEIANAHDSGQAAMPAQFDRREYWIDFGTFDFYQQIEELKTAQVTDSPSEARNSRYFDYIGHDPGAYLFERYVEQLAPDIMGAGHDYGYAHLDEWHIVQAGDPTSPVFDKELSSGGFTWFTSDEQAICCREDGNGSLFWLSDNCHAIGTLMDEYEKILQGQAHPDFISENSERNMHIYGKGLGIDLNGAVREAMVASSDQRSERDQENRNKQNEPVR